MRKLNLFLIIILCCTVSLATAEEKRAKKKLRKDPEISSVLMQVKGEIGDIGRKHITIIYGYNKEKTIAREMMLRLDDTVEFKHIKSIKQIKIGDTVRVQYEEVVADYGDRQEKKRKAVLISFVKSAEVKEKVERSREDQEK